MPCGHMFCTFIYRTRQHNYKYYIKQVALMAEFISRPVIDDNIKFKLRLLLLLLFYTKFYYETL